ncbi:MAG: hypothetical protein HY002_08920 [Candidatus Rokubacteria bacterium]|nr:hypothetical protein [Candidatus Rokubacteria bacterium]
MRLTWTALALRPDDAGEVSLRPGRTRFEPRDRDEARRLHVAIGGTKP